MNPTSVFCDHKRLRTSCPECKPPPPPPKPEPAPKAAPKREPKTGALGRPIRRRVKAPTREEAENAVAWWVQDKKS